MLKAVSASPSPTHVATVAGASPQRCGIWFCQPKMRLRCRHLFCRRAETEAPRSSSGSCQQYIAACCSLDAASTCWCHGVMATNRDKHPRIRHARQRRMMSQFRQRYTARVHRVMLFVRYERRYIKLPLRAGRTCGTVRQGKIEIPPRRRRNLRPFHPPPSSSALGRRQVAWVEAWEGRQRRA